MRSPYGRVISDDLSFLGESPVVCKLPLLLIDGGYDDVDAVQLHIDRGIAQIFPGNLHGQLIDVAEPNLNGQFQHIE